MRKSKLELAIAKLDPTALADLARKLGDAESKLMQDVAQTKDLSGLPVFADEARGLLRGALGAT